MSSRHLIDPEIVPILDLFPAQKFSAATLPQVRATFDKSFAEQYASLPDFPDVIGTEQYVPGPQGAPDVRVLIYRPKNVSTPLPALFWVHGGGYVIGRADQSGPQ